MGLFGNLFEKKIAPSAEEKSGFSATESLKTATSAKTAPKNFLRGSATDGTPPWMKSKSSLPIVKQTLNK